MKYIKFAINVLVAIGKAVAILLRILRVIKKKEESINTKDTQRWDAKFVLLFALLCLSVVFTSCTKNFYDEELRDEVITERAKIIEQSMLYAQDDKGEYIFTINYLTSFYTLALLGEGKLSEDDIVDVVKKYEKYLIGKRGE